MNQFIINKKRIEQSFRKSIDSYNQHAEVQDQICTKLLNALIEHCGTKFNQVLEIGAGTGLLTEKMIQNINIKNLYINDLVAEMQTPLSIICNHRDPLITQFLMGDAESIQLIPNNDLIISASTVQWFENHVLFLETKVKQNLVQNGIIAFSTFGPQNMKEIRSIEGNSLQYPSLFDLQNILDINFEILYLSEECIPLFFTTPLDVLNHIKQTGVNGIETKRWTKNDILRFTESYQRYYIKNKGYMLTYHPMYAICRIG